MTDTLTPAERSRRMASIRGRNTGPEMRVRRLLHGLGYRFRLHGRGLPGRPDLVFPSRSAVIFVHGCFWHRHADPECPLARMPKSRQEFWRPKLEANRARDAAVGQQLTALGWRAHIIWECELRNLDMVTRRVIEFLGRPGRRGRVERC